MIERARRELECDEIEGKRRDGERENTREKEREKGKNREQVKSRA